MRHHCSSIFMLLAGAMIVACSPASTPQTTGAGDGPPQETDPTALTLEVVSAECDKLIGSINAGAAHVKQMGSKAGADGKDEFESTALALEQVAQAIGEGGYRVPDLQRMGGFYMGVARAQAAVIREMNAAVAKGDEQQLAVATKKFEQLGFQEDTVVAELNLQCRGQESAPAAAP
jgi:hypothetical protein